MRDAAYDDADGGDVVLHGTHITIITIIIISACCGTVTLTGCIGFPRIDGEGAGRRCR